MKKVIAIILLLPSLAFADDTYTILIKNHRFEPAELNVPAGKKIKLIINNTDNTPEEFESHELKREKVIPGNAKATIYVGPLSPGKYPFFGEFNEATAKGSITAQ
jgi:Cupredoxin-like domain